MSRYVIDKYEIERFAIWNDAAQKESGLYTMSFIPTI